MFNYNLDDVDFLGSYQAGADIAAQRQNDDEMAGFKAKIEGLISNGQPREAAELMRQAGLKPADLGISISALLGGESPQFEPIQQSIGNQNSIAMQLGGATIAPLGSSPFGGF